MIYKEAVKTSYIFKCINLKLKTKIIIKKKFIAKIWYPIEKPYYHLMLNFYKATLIKNDSIHFK